LKKYISIIIFVFSITTATSCGFINNANNRNGVLEPIELLRPWVDDEPHPPIPEIPHIGAEGATETENGEHIEREPQYISTTRKLGVYDNAGGELMAYIRPFTAPVLEQRGRWVKILTDIGEGWVDLDFEPPFYQITEFIQRTNLPVSVFYENLETGLTFGFDEHRRFFGASAVKAPFGLYIFRLAELGLTSLDEIYTYTSADFSEGSGRIRHQYEVGATFTQQELLFLMLSPSDNIATRILRRNHSMVDYRQFIEDLGGNRDFIMTITNSLLSAHEAGFYMRETYRYAVSNGAYSHIFKEYLMQNRYAFIRSDYPLISKSGWAANLGGAYHDMAVVLAPSPYTLSILSTLTGAPSHLRAYGEISMFVQEFNDTWFPAPNDKIIEF
jgi:beta-lactamase class A